MVADIGETLFVNLLGMTQYPGQPFTGNIYRDIIMFLIVPTIFIVMVLYIMSGRIIPDKKLRIMLGVGAYLFIIAGGYYSFFALLAGPYFIFLIFILGVLGYLGSHFRRGGGPAGYSRGGGYSKHRSNEDAAEIRSHSRGHSGVNLNWVEKQRIQEDIDDLNDDIERAEKRKRDAKGIADEGRVVAEENKFIKEAEREIKNLEKAKKTFRL